MQPTLALLGDAVAAAHDQLATAFPGRGAAARPVAVGWGTVESARAELELGAALGSALGAFADAPDDDLLGARCRTASGGLALSVAVLEPVREWRLAAALARFDEGPVAVWFRLAPMSADGTTPMGDGPFGPERLVVGGRRDRHYLLLLDDPPGTISA